MSSGHAQAKGVIFFCDRRTEGECLGRQLFGSRGPRAIQINRSIVPHETLLFLFNTASKTFMGPCHASEVGNLLDPDAWSHRGEESAFPVQARVYPCERNGQLFALNAYEVQDCLCYANGKKHFELTLEPRQASMLADRLRQSGRWMRR